MKLRAKFDELNAISAQMRADYEAFTERMTQRFIEAVGVQYQKDMTRMVRDVFNVEWPPSEEVRWHRAASESSMEEYSAEEWALGKKNYEAYAKKVGGRTHDGQAMPAWDETPGERCLTDNIRRGWVAGALAVKIEVTHQHPDTM